MFDVYITKTMSDIHIYDYLWQPDPYGVKLTMHVNNSTWTHSLLKINPPAIPIGILRLQTHVHLIIGWKNIKNRTPS